MMWLHRTKTPLQSPPRQTDQKTNKTLASSYHFKALEGSQLDCHMVINIVKFAKGKVFQQQSVKLAVLPVTPPFVLSGIGISTGIWGMQIKER